LGDVCRAERISGSSGHECRGCRRGETLSAILSISLVRDVHDQQTVSAEQALVEADRAMYAAKRVKTTTT
jgi:GGDEF domain-containing protein